MGTSSSNIKSNMKSEHKFIGTVDYNNRSTNEIRVIFTNTVDQNDTNYVRYYIDQFKYKFEQLKHIESLKQKLETVCNKNIVENKDELLEQFIQVLKQKLDWDFNLICLYGDELNLVMIQGLEHNTTKEIVEYCISFPTLTQTKPVYLTGLELKVDELKELQFSYDYFYGRTDLLLDKLKMHHYNYMNLTEININEINCVLRHIQLKYK